MDLRLPTPKPLRRCFDSDQHAKATAAIWVMELAIRLLRWVATLGLGHRGLVAAETLRCRREAAD